MQISPATSVSAATARTTTGANDAMGKQDFLTLLVAQLEHQDPMEPMDNSAFVAQMAQFSSLEQLMNVGQGMADLVTMQQADQNTEIVGFIGKDVTTVGSTVDVTSTSKPDFTLQLSGNAKHVQVELVDEQGAVVATGEASGYWPAGQARLSWEDFTWSGTPSAGSYAVRTGAEGSYGSVTATPLTVGRVTGVSFEQGVPMLMVGDQQLSLSAVLSVSES